MTSLYNSTGLAKILGRLVFSVALAFIGGTACATTYQMPMNPGDTVLELFPNGNATTTIVQDETLLDVALRYTLGQTEIIKLNPKVDRWLIKKGQVVRLPNRRILPDTPRSGVTLNISEFRMYYYPPGQKGEVMSFAHGIGRQDWKTPLGKTSVIRKVKDPAWHPPESIRREHAAMGDPLPVTVPPGPHNPLGTRALYLNLPGEYRIHGTDVDKIYGIGMQITHGCVRMYPEDVETLYDVVPVGTSVHIVKQPIKVGWLDNTLYIEAHPDLEGEDMGRDQRYGLALRLIEKATKESMAEVDQKALNQALTDLDGEPVAIYERVGAYNPMAQPSPMPYSPSPISGSQSLPPSPPPMKAVQPMAPLPPPVSAPAPAEETQLPSDSDIIPLPAPKGGSPGGYYHGT
jgi:L,D-transpeptidase ErfK/SrfK